MNRGRARRHYRVAKKQIQQSHKKGMCLPKDKKNIAITIGVLLMLLAFMKGLLLGMLLGRHTS